MSTLPGPPLRIAVLGDFDGPHTRAWVRTFVERGHDVHAISYYPPAFDLPGLTVHVLAGARRDAASARSAAASPASRLPPSLMRLIHAWRYRRAGLRRVLDEIKPDIFHAHYAVEHGFYGALAGYHPYVVSAWGSDLLVESHKVVGKHIAKWALSKADLVTGNDVSLVQRAIELGVAPEKATVIHLGIERAFLDAGSQSVNLREDDDSPLTIISYRALEPLYNIDIILRAFAAVQNEFPNARLIMANDGSLGRTLRHLGDASVQFVGKQDQSWLTEQLAKSHIAVSIPSSDSLALSNLEAMASGAFPVVSDLPSLDGWIQDGVNGLRLPPSNVAALAHALRRAMGDPELRRNAAMQNRQLVEARGLREPNMLLMERHYYRLAGHPLNDQAI